MTPQELRNAAIQKRREAQTVLWEGKTKPVSPPCENCGKAKLGPAPQPQKGKK